mgnify:CR=1 FL=1
MKKLTRILALTLCCLLAAGLAACGETPAPTPDPDPDPGSAIGGNTQIPNPRVPYENDEFPDFKLAGYPDRDGMKPTGFYLIGGTIGEISYETATLRCAADTGEGEDLSGVYYPDAEESELSVGHSYCGIITVTVKEHSEGTVALWKSCEGDFVYSLWLPGQTGDGAKALVREFAAGVYVVLPGGEEPLTGDVFGTEKELTRWREVIRAENIAKVMAMDHNTMTEPVELTPEKAGQLIGLLAESADRLTVYEKLPNPATGGALRLTAYDTEGNALFTVCDDGRLVVTFGNEMTNYVFDASACGLDGKFALD